VIIAQTPVHISTSLPEEALQNVVAFVEERLSKHEKSAAGRLDDNRKAEMLIITLLDVAAELFSTKREVRKLKQMESDAFAAVDVLNRRLDDFSEQLKK
jgi:hypothetical protein